MAFIPHYIVTPEDLSAVTVADIDGDSDIDIVLNSDDHSMGWYENTDSQGAFEYHEIDRVDALGSLVASDVDSDGDLDLITGSWEWDGIAWYENADGLGTFSSRKAVAEYSSVMFVSSLVAADLDGDLDVDIAAAHTYGWSWYENIGAHEMPWPVKTIEGTRGVDVLEAADVNGDGNLDLIAGFSQGRYATEGSVKWYEYSDTLGTFGDGQTIVTQQSGVDSVEAMDIDGDGDQDIIVSASSGTQSSLTTAPDNIAWYENTDGQGTFGAVHVITTQVDGPAAVLAADVDRDGDLDVISAAYRLATWNPDTQSFQRDRFRSLFWYENTDGRGTLGSPFIINDATFGYTDELYAADIDGDSGVDLIYATAWYETRIPGDANGDNSFDPQDLVQVMASGKYGTGLAADYAEGDWNGDGVFDQFDIVAALQGGRYLDDAAGAVSSTAHQL
jgi:hypothetical protein